MEEEHLLRSLDEAMRDIDAGKGASMEDVRKLLAASHCGPGIFSVQT